MTEAQLLDAVVQLAQTLGWRVLHMPVQGDGFPNLLLLRNSRGIAAECKSARGKLIGKQIDWLQAFSWVGFEVHLWRPVDWTSGQIEQALQRMGGGRIYG